MANTNLDERNGRALVVTAALFLILSWISVLLRIYVRTVLTHGFQLDDWLMLIALIIFTLSCSFIISGVVAGLGHHNAELPLEKEIPALMWQALATATYILNMMFIKLSIGIFLLRLAVKKIYRRIIWGSLFIVGVWSIVLFFWDLFQCRPLEAQWDYTLPDFKCVTADQIVAAAYALSVMTILTDWFYALLPIPMLWNVKMTKQAKVTVILVLSLGIFASVATLVRLRFLASLENTDDILFAGTDAMVWTLIEPGVAIIASSLATIRPLLRAWRVSGFESTGRTGGTGGTGGHSGAPRSGTSRSLHMGLYLNHDLEAQAIQPHAKFQTFSAASRSKTPPSSNVGEVEPKKEKRRDEAKSEIFVIEGDRVREEPGADNTIASQSSSSLDMDDYEPQGQDVGRIGLGGGQYEHSI